MIVFEGQISGKCKEGVLRRGARISFIGGLITSILFAIPTVVLALKIDLIVLLFFLVLFLNQRNAMIRSVFQKQLIWCQGEMD